MADLPQGRRLAGAVKEAAEQVGVSERRLRRWIAISALIEVFNIASSQGALPPFLVKGGFALEARFGSRARASRDIDIVIETEMRDLMDAAIEAMRTEWSGFSFRIKGEPEERKHSYKFDVNASYREYSWSTFEVELVAGDVVNPEMLAPYPLDEFGLDRPSTVPAMNVYEQIAQKLHAVSDPDENRPRDLVDIFLISRQTKLDVETLREAAEAVFSERGSHAWPPAIELRDGWHVVIEKIIQENQLALAVESIVDGVRELVTPRARSRGR